MTNNRRLVLILVILLVISAGAALLFYSRLAAVESNPRLDAKTEVKDLVAKIGRHIELPQDEDPTVATVTDPKLLKDQPFFANARRGNKVLIYTKAKKAVLYDPESDKLVEVAPVAVSNPPAATIQVSSTAAIATSTSTPKSKKKH